MPFLGVPRGLAEPPAFTGDGVKIAVIDTGIDYTHANFGGPGTVAAYEAADAADTTLGDAADAACSARPRRRSRAAPTSSATPTTRRDTTPALHPASGPEPARLQRTAASATARTSPARRPASASSPTARTYDGPYDSTTYTDNDFEIGPGVAPEADLYFVRVFGCDGSTDVTVEAIDWAVDNDMDVINMSLGSPFGRDDDPSAVAATNAAAAGVSVVTLGRQQRPDAVHHRLAGHRRRLDRHGGDRQQRSRSQASSLDLDAGRRIHAIAANGIRPAGRDDLRVVVLADDPATTRRTRRSAARSRPTPRPASTRGRRPARGRRARRRAPAWRAAIFGQQAGAAAVAMVNNAAGFPPFEGPILSNPDTGDRRSR